MSDEGGNDFLSLFMDEIALCEVVLKPLSILKKADIFFSEKPK